MRSDSSCRHTICPPQSLFFLFTFLLLFCLVSVASFCALLPSTRILTHDAPTCELIVRESLQQTEEESRAKNVVRCPLWPVDIFHAACVCLSVCQL